MIRYYIVNKVDRYTIRFDRESGGTYSLHAVEHPADPYGKGAHLNHLFPSGKICISSGHEPRTLDRAKAIAMFWCEGWSSYIRTGNFSNQGKKVVV